MERVRATNRVCRWMAAATAVALVMSACGGDDDSSGDGDTGAVADDDVSEPAGDVGDGDGDSGGGSSGGSAGAGGGMLVLGDETITFDSARCFLEEQDAAAGGGKILFVAQAYGTNAAGEELVLDVSRYDEDSQFVGDDILIDIGDPFSEEAVSLGGGGETGTVTLDGSTLSADGLTFNDFDDFAELTGSFEINC